MKMMKRKSKKNNNENIGTKKVQLGTLYDANKMLIEKTVADLTLEELEEKKNLIIDFIKNTDNHYYMLLCNERKDYTVFHRGDGIEALQDILIDECIPNRGRAKGINLTEDKEAIEIWISVNGESCCYYFFPYDTAIIEC